MSNYLTGLAQLNPQVKRHNGGTTTLTLDENGTTNATMLFVNGVAQTPGIDFNVSGATLTTTSTLPAGTNIATTIQYFNTGVVNTVADDAIGLGQMASGTDGNLITYDASGNPAHVATGSDGQVLTSAGAGAAPAFEALPARGTTLINRATFSTASTVAITGFTSATYDSYQIRIHGIVSNDSVNVNLRTSTDGGSSYDSGSNNYAYAGNYIRSDAASSTSCPVGGRDDTEIQLNLDETVGNASGEGFDFTINILRPDDATNRTTFLWQGAYLDTSTRTVTVSGSGSRASAADVDAIQILPSAGTLTGSYQFIGFNNS
jgi:hypothetical protein